MKAFWKKRNRRGGFLLTELLIVVAIIGILGAVAVPNGAQMIRSSRQVNMDRLAQTIYLAANRNLTSLAAAGQAGKTLEIELEKEDSGATLERTGIRSATLSADSNSPSPSEEYKLYGVSHLSGTDYVPIAEPLLGKQVISAELYNGCWYISVDPYAASVTDVFYADASNDESLKEVFKKHVIDDDGKREELKDSAARLALADGKIGYYHGDGNALPVPTEPPDNFTCAVKVNNGEELTVDYRVVLPSDDRFFKKETNQPLGVKLTLTVTGVHSNAAAKYVAKYNVDDTTNVGTYDSTSHTYSNRVALDSFNNKQQFKNIGTTDDIRGFHISSNSGNFTPGENLIITVSAEAKAKIGDDEVWLPATPTNDGEWMASATVNSLFDTRSSSDSNDNLGNIITISCGRHLQNLDRAVAGADLNENHMAPDTAENLTVTQTGKIDFTTTEPKSWASLYTGAFIPITNNQIEEFYGGGKSDKPEECCIVGLTVDLDKPVVTITPMPINAGLFATFNGSKLYNVYLINPTICESDGTAQGNAGALAGETAKDTTIFGCRVWLTDTNHQTDPETDNDTNSDTATAVNTVAVAAVNTATAVNAVADTVAVAAVNAVADTVVAAADTVVAAVNVVADTVVAAADTDTPPIRGLITGKTAAGGLIGKADAKLTISDSFAAATVKATGTDSAVGGLVGTVESGMALTVSKSYADCYLTAATVGGLLGSGSGTFTTCYSGGFAVGNDVTNAGGFIGNGTATLSGNNISLFNFDDVTNAFNDTTGTRFDTSKLKVGTEGDKAGYVTEYPDFTSNFTKYGIAPSVDGTGKGYFCYGGNVTEVTEAEYCSVEEIIKKLNIPIKKLNIPLIQTTSSYVNFPNLLSDLPHYGDWLERPKAEAVSGIALVYFERYTDGSYSIYEKDSMPNSLASSGTATLDGYGIWCSEEVDILEYTIKVGDMTVVIGNDSACVSVNDGKLYPLPWSILNDTISNEGDVESFYKEVTIEKGGTETKHYYFNPHFAKTNVQQNDKPTEFPTTVYVRSPRQLWWLQKSGASLWSETYQQELDIDYSGYAWGEGATTHMTCPNPQVPIGTGTGDSAFSGTYNGGCHVITGVNIGYTDDNKGQYVGLFGYNTGTLKNIVLATDSGKYSIYYTSNAGDISVGGIVGYNAAGKTVTNCAIAGYNIQRGNTTAISKPCYVGGFVGQNMGTITNSSTALPLISAQSSSASVGGFAGRNGDNNSSAVIQNCYAIGVIETSGTAYGFGQIGNNAQYTNCYCAVAPKSGALTGAFTNSATATVTNCYYYSETVDCKYAGSAYAFGQNTESRATKVNQSRLSNSTDSNSVNLGNQFKSADESKYDSLSKNNNPFYDKFPYPAVVTDASGAHVHYGEWPYTSPTIKITFKAKNIEMGTLYYWPEKEYFYSYSQEDDQYTRTENLPDAFIPTNPLSRTFLGYYIPTDNKTEDFLISKNGPSPVGQSSADTDYPYLAGNDKRLIGDYKNGEGDGAYQLKKQTTDQTAYAVWNGSYCLLLTGLTAMHRIVYDALYYDGKNWWKDNKLTIPFDSNFNLTVPANTTDRTFRYYFLSGNSSTSIVGNDGKQTANFPKTINKDTIALSAWNEKRFDRYNSSQLTDGEYVFLTRKNMRILTGGATYGDEMVYLLASDEDKFNAISGKTVVTDPENLIYSISSTVPSNCIWTVEYNKEEDSYKWHYFKIGDKYLTVNTTASDDGSYSLYLNDKRTDYAKWGTPSSGSANRWVNFSLAHASANRMNNYYLNIDRANEATDEYGQSTFPYKVIIGSVINEGNPANGYNSTGKLISVGVWDSMLAYKKSTNKQDTFEISISENELLYGTDNTTQFGKYTDGEVVPVSAS